MTTTQALGIPIVDLREQAAVSTAALPTSIVVLFPLRVDCMGNRDDRSTILFRTARLRVIVADRRAAYVCIMADRRGKDVLWRLYRGVPAVILAACMATVVNGWATGDPLWEPFPAAVGFTAAALAIWYVAGRLIGNETRRALGAPLDHSIRVVSKEGVEYREGDTGYEFWIGSVVDIPRSEDWDRVVPEAFRGRREEVVERMKRSRISARTPFRDVFA